jgi:anti-anti-sigma factor
MPAESPSNLVVEDAQGVTIVRLPAMDVFDEGAVRDLSRYFESLVLSAPADPRFLVDLSALEMATSRVLGILLALRAKVEGRNGRLRLTGCSTGSVANAFRVTNLDRVFAIDPDEPTALAAF